MKIGFDTDGSLQIILPALSVRLERLRVHNVQMDDLLPRLSAIWTPPPHVFPRLTAIALDDMGLDDADVVALVSLTRLMRPALTHLELPNNRIGSAGAALLADATHFSSLALLDLRGNFFGGLGRHCDCSIDSVGLPHAPSLGITRA